MVIVYLPCLCCFAMCAKATTLNAQEPPVDLPPIWKELEQETRVLVKPHKDITSYPIVNEAWKTAERIAKRHDRNTISQLYRTHSAYEKSLTKCTPILVKLGTLEMATYVAVIIADGQETCGLRSVLVHWPGTSYSTRWRHVLIAAMACYGDDYSRNWLFELAMNDDDTEEVCSEFVVPGPSYFSLQLLRGYSPTRELSERLNQILSKEVATRKTAPSVSPAKAGPGVILAPKGESRSNKITKAEAVKSVISSWDFASRLSKSKQAQYRKYQSALWRFSAIVPDNFHLIEQHYASVGSYVLKEIPNIEDDFILQIFRNDSHSTPDEAMIGVNLANQKSLLEKIALTDSLHAAYARKLLEALNRQKLRERERNEQDRERVHEE